MNVSAGAICLIVAIVLFAIAALIPLWIASPRVHLVAAGLFFYALKDLVG